MRVFRRIPPPMIVAGLMLVTGASLAAILRSRDQAAPLPGAKGATSAAESTEHSPFQSPGSVPSAPGAVASAPPPAAGAFDLDRIAAQIDLSAAVVEDGRLVQRLGDGTAIVLTVRPAVQEALVRILEKYDVPIGAVVAIEVDSGRVVAMAGRTRGPVEHDPCLDATAPAASIFKIVTTAALLEEVGVGSDETVCYRNGAGRSRLTLQDVIDETSGPGDGITCSTLSDGLARSINPVVARLADVKLSPRVLLRYAEKFAFGRALPFELPVDVSPVEIPQDRLEFARTAAGFWHVGLSPLHAASVVQLVARGGELLQPTLIDSVVAADGTVLYTSVPRVLRRVIDPETAAAIERMMVETVASGTGKRDFHDPKGEPFIAVPVAGKTGSLTHPRPFMAYSWFVGYAPAGEVEATTPRYAVAALVVNEERWRIKGAFLAREALRLLLAP